MKRIDLLRNDITRIQRFRLCKILSFYVILTALPTLGVLDQVSLTCSYPEYDATIHCQFHFDNILTLLLDHIMCYYS